MYLGWKPSKTHNNFNCEKSRRISLADWLHVLAGCWVVEYGEVIAQVLPP
jgi:hypothetical protein